MASVEDLLKKQECIRVFGYGSLVWKPDFEYDKVYLGYIEGYERRFWQGSTHHRGTVEKPGRVLTLTKKDNGRCWGVVYEVTGTEKVKTALDYLQTRERRLGHYDIVIVPVIIPADEGGNKPLYSILYYATPQNALFLGDGCMKDIAENIATSKGVSGHNAEYLLRLTDFMRKSVPNEVEEHLYELDRLVRVKIGLGTNNVLPWNTLITLESFHRKLLCTKLTGTELRPDERTSAILAVV